MNVEHGNIKFSLSLVEQFKDIVCHEKSTQHEKCVDRYCRIQNCQNTPVVRQLCTLNKLV